MLALFQLTQEIGKKGVGFLFVFFLILNFAFLTKMLKLNVRIFFYITVPKRFFNQIEYNPLSTPGLTLILRLCMPKNADI